MRTMVTVTDSGTFVTMHAYLRALVNQSSHPAIEALGWRVLEPTNVTVKAQRDGSVEDIPVEEVLDFAEAHGPMARGNIGSDWATLGDATSEPFKVRTYGRTSDGSFEIGGTATVRDAPLTEGLADWLDTERRTRWRDDPYVSQMPNERDLGRQPDTDKWLNALTTPERLERLTALYTPTDWRFWVEFVWRLQMFRHKWDSIEPALAHAEQNGLRQTVIAMVKVSEIPITWVPDMGDEQDEAKALRSIFGRG